MSPRKAALLVVAAVALTPVEMGVAYTRGEPYPAVFQPKFMGSPEKAGTVRFDLPRVYAVVDGTDREVGPDALLPSDTQVSTVAVVKRLFPTDQRDRELDDTTVRWLLGNVADHVDNTAVTSVRVVWTERVVDTRSRRASWGAERAEYVVRARRP